MRRDRSHDYTKGNATAAEIILANPHLYPVGSGLERWARAWQASHPQREPKRWQREAVKANSGTPQQLALAFENERGAGVETEGSTCTW